MMRTTVGLAICAVSMGGSVSSDGCWRREENTWMPCYPRDPADSTKRLDQVGTKEAMKQKCIEMGIGCMAVTCTKDDDTCTLRHALQCETDSGKPIQKSPTNEITYIKQCELSKYDFVKHPNSYIKCYNTQEDFKGDLLERQIRCAALGPQACFGITCNANTEFPNGYDCIIKDHRSCSEVVDIDEVTNSDEVKQISYVMKSNGPAPVVTPGTPVSPANGGCAFTKNVETQFGCGTPENKEMTLEEAKLQCDQASTVANSCIGVLCAAGSSKGCKLHYRCQNFNQKNFLVADKQFDVYVKTCSDGAQCVTPCHEYEEANDHRCGNDCHCKGTRLCGPGGYCTNSNGFTESCLLGDCVFQANENTYYLCVADDNQVGTTLKDAQQRCRELGDACVGVTCEQNGLCTTRFPGRCGHSDNLLQTSTTHEVTYNKCCGSRELQERFCPRAFKSSSSSHAGLYIFFIILLIVIVGGLFYKNRQMANNFIAPDAFKAVPHNDADV